MHMTSSDEFKLVVTGTQCITATVYTLWTFVSYADYSCLPSVRSADVPANMTATSTAFNYVFIIEVFDLKYLQFVAQK